MLNLNNLTVNNNNDCTFERNLSSSLITNNKNNQNNITLSNNSENEFIHYRNTIIILYYNTLVRERDILKITGSYKEIPFTIELLEKELNNLKKFININPLDYFLHLPPKHGSVKVGSRKIFIPVDKYPKYNFIGRILGPKGGTAKEFENRTGCKIMIRGKGSMKDKSKEGLFIGKPNYQHLNEPLHVLLQTEDTLNRIDKKLDYAEEELQKLMFPISCIPDILKRPEFFGLHISNRKFSRNDFLIKKLLLSSNDYTNYQSDICPSNSSNPYNFSDFEALYNSLENKTN
ncbi:Protein quaking [Strongyloides ratti]|uniref:Protein quaking n=1 Tax=Strongyloides ratti TaxID=34506 RepID=A0A090MY09_STRRB|nr:Protein quaking [Strongyloides ratti]CEF66364.1 Protein quaking [Strongyloides ratti]